MNDPSLPIDIFTEVIPCVWDDLRTLKACSLVNRSFCGIAQPIIFKNYFFGFHYRTLLNALTNLSLSFHHLFPAVRHFSVSAQLLRSDCTALLLSLLSGLESLDIQRDDAGNMPRAVLDTLCQVVLPSIRHLHLDDINAWSEQMPHFLQLCSHLSSLSSMDEIPKVSNTFLNTPFPLLHLRRLHLRLNSGSTIPIDPARNVPALLAANNVPIEKIHFSTSAVSRNEQLFQRVTDRIIDTVSLMSNSLSHVTIGALVHPDWHNMSPFPFASLPQLNSLAFHVAFDWCYRDEDAYGEEQKELTGTLIWVTRSIRSLADAGRSSTQLRRMTILNNDSPCPLSSEWVSIKMVFEDLDVALASSKSDAFPQLQTVLVVTRGPRTRTFMGLQLPATMDEKGRICEGIHDLFPHLSSSGLLYVKEAVCGPRKWWEEDPDIDG